MDSDQLKQSARAWGADATGIADLERLDGIETEPEDLLRGFTRAVSVGVRLSDAIMDEIADRPTPLYAQHYAKVNAFLDHMALRVTGLLQERGARALPIPASQVLDRERFTSYISHKAVAIAAGVGWQGKSLLVVHPRFGPRIRLVTVLTDADLTPDKPLTNRCGKCSECADACPARAIRNVNTTLHYADREEAVHLDRCVDHVRANAELPFIDSFICGVCIRACPFGRPRRRRAD